MEGQQHALWPASHGQDQKYMFPNWYNFRTSKGVIAQEMKLWLGGWLGHWHLHIWNSNVLCHCFPMWIIYLFFLTNCITTIQGCVLNSWGDSLSCVLYSLLILCWSCRVPALSPLWAELSPPLLLGMYNSATFLQYLPQYKISPDFISRTYKWSRFYLWKRWRFELGKDKPGLHLNSQN